MKKTVKAVSSTVLVLFAALLFMFAASAEGEVVLKAQNVDNGISLKWTETEDVHYYEIYREESDSESETLLSRSQATEFLDESAQAGVLYSYRVVPVIDEEGENEGSNTVNMYFITAPKLSDAMSQEGGISLKWTASQGALGYGVFRQTDGSGKWELVGKTAQNVTSLVDTKVSTSESYTYLVRGYASKFLSAVSNVVGTDFVSSPKITRLESGEQGVLISWDKVSGSQYYLLYRKTSEDKKWNVIALFDGEHDVYVDKTVKQGLLASYLLRAVDENGKLGSYDKGTLIRHMSKPVFTSAASASNGVKLTWTKVEGCENYAIFRREIGAAEKDWKFIGKLKGQDSVVAVDKKVINGTTYAYAVRAMWGEKFSAYDTEGVTVRYIQAPTQLSLEVDTANGNVLKWKGNEKVSHYYVYRKPSQGKWQIIGETTETYFGDTKANSAENYSYTVRGYISSTCYSGAGEIQTTRPDHIDPTKPMIALTFDDGPGYESTLRILDTLEAYNAKATFFVLGELVEENYEVVQRAYQMGCEIGNHTYSHLNLLYEADSNDEIISQINMTDKVLKKYIGTESKVVRAVGGDTDENVRATVGKPLFYWSVDTRDWESRDSAQIIPIVQQNAYDGAIVLMHDIYDSTAEASEYLIPYLVNQGYQLVTVSELMKYKGNITPQIGHSYEDAFTDQYN